MLSTALGETDWQPDVEDLEAGSMEEELNAPSEPA
jgi:hypothetical protein